MLIAGAVAAGFGARAWARARAVANLPALADLAGLPPAIAAHLREAYEAARRAPGSAEVVGALCTAYHADLRFDDARRCYDRVQALDSDWRWEYARALIDIELGGTPELAGRLRAIAARAPEFGPVWLRLGDAEFKAGRYDAAAEAWRRAAALPPLDPDTAATPPHVPEASLASYASFGLARVALVARRRRRRRGEILEGMVRVSPGFGPAFRLLGESYRALGLEAESARAVIGPAGCRPSRRSSIRSWMRSRASRATARCCCAWRRRRR